MYWIQKGTNKPYHAEWREGVLVYVVEAWGYRSDGKSYRVPFLVPYEADVKEQMRLSLEAGKKLDRFLDVG